MKDLYNPEVYKDCLNRLSQIKVETKPQWGKMNAAQMFSHCAEIIDVMNGKILEKTPWFVKLLAPLIKKGVTNDKPYPKNSRTHPQYIVADDRIFSAEKSRLLESLSKFYTMDKEEAIKVKHTLFGTLSLEERGKSMYKHLDHHLQQFGV